MNANMYFGIRATQIAAKFAAQERAIRAAEADRRAYAVEASRLLARQC